MTSDPNRARVEAAATYRKHVDAVNRATDKEMEAAIAAADALPSQADAQRVADLQAEVVRLREALTALSHGDIRRWVRDLVDAALEHKEADRG